MAKVDLQYPYKELHGKISKKGEFVIVQNSQTRQHFSRHWTGRDFDAHPVTVREAQTHDRMKEAVAAYHALKNDPVAYGEFMALYNQEMELLATLSSSTSASSSAQQTSGSEPSLPAKQPKRPRPYNFFISRYLDEGKHSDKLRLAHTSTSVESYVEAIRECPDQSSATAVLLDFLRTIGFPSLADAYQQKSEC